MHQAAQPIPSQQLPQCSICKYDPVPQSSQHILLSILQIILIFVDWRFSIILVMLGFSFPQTHWKCPVCEREVPVGKEHNTSDSLVIRLGKCMALFSLNKFRIVAGAIVLYMLYLIGSQRLNNPKKFVTKTWTSMIQACGFEVYMENSVHSNRAYSNYLDSGYDWEFQAIYLYRQPTGIENFQNIYFKMDPTQFKDPQAYDFKAFTKNAVGMQFSRGDVIRMKGEWQGRQYHNFIFNPIEIVNTHKHKDPASCSYFYDKSSLLRSHLDAVKGEYGSGNEGKQKIVEVKQAQAPQPVQAAKAMQPANDDHVREEESTNLKGKLEN